MLSGMHMTGGESARIEKTGEQDFRCCLTYLVLKEWKTCNAHDHVFPGMQVLLICSAQRSNCHREQSR